MWNNGRPGDNLIKKTKEEGKRKEVLFVIVNSIQWHGRSSALLCQCRNCHLSPQTSPPSQSLCLCSFKVPRVEPHSESLELLGAVFSPWPEIPPPFSIPLCQSSPRAHLGCASRGIKAVPGIVVLLLLNVPELRAQNPLDLGFLSSLHSENLMETESFWQI